MIHLFHELTLNTCRRALLVCTCCLSIIIGSALLPNDANAWERGDKVVVQNQPGLRVREDTRIGITDNIITLLPNGAKGTIKNGPKRGQNNSLTWYEVSWETPTKVQGWSAESQNGCVYLITPERAIQKDKLVEILFDLDKGTADAKTYHDYNGYGCDPNDNNACDGYRDGHSGWDVQTISVAGNASADEDFYALTSGEVISVGGSFGRIAVYNEVYHPTTVIYLHARHIYVKKGDWVDVGDRLGIQGDTSRNAIGEHVHIEVRTGYQMTSACGASTAIDPVPYLYKAMNSEPTSTENDGHEEVDTILRIAPASVESPRLNQELEFSLKIEDGKDVFGYQATITFDKTALRYASSANGDYLSGNPYFKATLDGNAVTLASTAFVGVSNGDGTLATLLFEVVSVKDSAITITDALLSDIDGKGFIPHVENAEVTKPKIRKEDINGDGKVNILDLVLVASKFGESGTADVNGDGTVDILDLVLVAKAFGDVPAAPTSARELTAAHVQQWLHLAKKEVKVASRPSYARGIVVLEQLHKSLIPKATALLANYPNPFNPETWIPYHLAKGSDVQITIYNAAGNVVRTLTLGHQSKGYYTDRSRAAYWNGRNTIGECVASGVYFYQLQADIVSSPRKMLILK